MKNLSRANDLILYINTTIFYDRFGFQIEFDSLSDELFEKLSKIPHVKNPSRVGHSLHFYGRERKVFFEVLSEAASSTMKDIRIKKLGLQDLMDAKYAKDGIH